MVSIIKWDVIENFIGYGRKDAPVVFIGMEEGLAASEDIEENLLRRSAYGIVKDLRPQTTKLQSTWRVMCELMLMRAGIEVPGVEEKRQYQTHRLGSSDGDTLLSELLPYPKSKRSDWPNIYRQRYETQEDYIHQMVPRRQRLISSLFADVSRELIVIYGKEHFERYQGIFGDNWSAQPPFLRTTAFGARVLVSPHLTSISFAKHRKRFFELALG